MKEELSIDQILSSIKKVIAGRDTKAQTVENCSDKDTDCQLKIEKKISKGLQQVGNKENFDEDIYELTECISEGICDKSAITDGESVYNLSAFEDIGAINARILNELADIKNQLENNQAGLKGWLNDNLPQIVSGLVKKEIKKLNVKNNSPNL
ncbi:hypothetical protein phytr_1230 [Candidatus Phycorickettsia trachydisci]|uniref:Uncharacterized protein n=1 Tax=Candidatus Phycorickettsia trachydisci TaxID=2115978 RepID=A0A2P1P734_9RICK|nr:DUF2497 domain-containing protein [Candidatus Phycorickettsia trachydisci]AVP87083.1 hypothetical protein phytr_1230 [Candidatus Phycorickettsia trachydisci]